jgi:hypothetical protein
MSDDKVLTADEVRAKVIEDFGFNEDDDAERIEKLTNERLENQKNLSTAIRQKVDYRKRLQDALGEEGEKPEGDIKKSNQPQADDVNLKLRKLELKTNGYDDEEVELITTQNLDLSNAIVLAGIQARRADKKAQEAIPEGSAKSPVFKNFTNEQLANMSSAELEKILPHKED